MEESILNEIKQMLGLNDPTYVVFDTDIKIAINAAIGILNQIGIGVEGFFLTNSTQTWKDLLGEDNLGFQIVKEYVFLKTKIVFDPPTAGFVLDSYNNIVKELEYRLNVIYEAANVTQKESKGGCDCHGLTPDQLHSLIDQLEGGEEP